MSPLARTTRVAAGLLVAAGVALATIPAQGIEYDEIVLTRDQPEVTIHLDPLAPSGIRHGTFQDRFNPAMCAPEPDCALVPIRVDAELAPDEDAVVTVSVAWVQQSGDPTGHGIVNAIPDIDAAVWAQGSDCPPDPEPEPEVEPSEEGEEEGEEEVPLPEPPPPPDIPLPPVPDPLDTLYPFDGCEWSFNANPSTNPIVKSTDGTFTLPRLLIVYNAIGPNPDGVDVTAQLSIARRFVPDPPLPALPAAAAAVIPSGASVGGAPMVPPTGPSLVGDVAPTSDALTVALDGGDIAAPTAIADLAAGAEPPSVLADARAETLTTDVALAADETSAGGWGPATSLLVIGLGLVPMLLLARRSDDDLPADVDPS